MKYENLNRCTELCSRIENLQNTLEYLEGDGSLAFAISHYWDMKFPAIKQWDTDKPTEDASSEEGLYTDLFSDFRFNITHRIKIRIGYLKAELAKL